MEKKIPTYLLVIDDSVDSELQVDAISMVDAPAIERNFLAFNEDFVEPSKGEHKDKFVPRCIEYVIGEGKEPNQAAAICNSIWDEHFAAEKVSIDYDDTLSTDKGKELAKQLIDKGYKVYIISARPDVDGMLEVADKLGIMHDCVYATGSNEAKIAKIKELGISKHYDNNSDVVSALGTIGHQFAARQSFAINDEKMELFGAAMLADMPIYRNDQQLGEYYVVFDKATIYTIAQKFFEKGFYQNFNLMHDPAQKTSGVFVFQSYIVDSEEGRMPPKGFEDAKDGSWFIGVKVNNPEVWAKVKSGEIKGFSVEGVFEYKKKGLTAEQIYNEIGKLLAGLNDTTN
jgi:hypothetical protein